MSIKREVKSVYVGLAGRQYKIWFLNEAVGYAVNCVKINKRIVYTSGGQEIPTVGWFNDFFIKYVRKEWFE
jgi:hypothetical protein